MMVLVISGRARGGTEFRKSDPPNMDLPTYAAFRITGSLQGFKARIRPYILLGLY